MFENYYTSFWNECEGSSDKLKNIQSKINENYATLRDDARVRNRGGLVISSGLKSSKVL